MVGTTEGRAMARNGMNGSKAPSPEIPPGSPVVTISATYGAGGSVVGPLLAELLGLPFCDRPVAPSADEEASAHFEPGGSGESVDSGERRAVPAAGFFGRLAPAWSLGTAGIPPSAFGDRDEIRRRSESEMAQALALGGVVLGRAGALVYAGEPSAYHVRLDGPATRRAERAALLETISAAQAIERMSETDRLRSALTSRLYGADWADPDLYHLALDTTVLALESAADLVAKAALAFWSLSAVDQPAAANMVQRTGTWSRSEGL